MHFLQFEYVLRKELNSICEDIISWEMHNRLEFKDMAILKLNNKLLLLPGLYNNTQFTKLRNESSQFF